MTSGHSRAPRQRRFNITPSPRFGEAPCAHASRQEARTGASRNRPEPPANPEVNAALASRLPPPDQLDDGATLFL
jgi:hypothetical protein